MDYALLFSSVRFFLVFYSVGFDFSLCGACCCLSWSHYLFSISLAQLYCWIILTTQPFYIAGIEDASKAQSSAFGAVVMFIATFALSIGGIWYDSMYKAEPMIEDGAPEAEYHLSKDGVPTYGTTS